MITYIDMIIRIYFLHFLSIHWIIRNDTHKNSAITVEYRLLKNKNLCKKIQWIILNLILLYKFTTLFIVWQWNKLGKNIFQ